MNQTVKSNLSVEEVKSLAEAKGKKLGFLIASLKIDETTREALLDLLPTMTLEQLDKFTDLLEASFLHGATGAIDKELAQALEQIDVKYQNQVQAADAEAASALQGIAKSLQGKQG